MTSIIDHPAFQVISGIIVVLTIIEFILYGGVYTWGFLAVFFKSSSKQHDSKASRGSQWLSVLMLILFWGLRSLYIPMFIYIFPKSNNSANIISQTYLDVCLWVIAALWIFTLILPLIALLGSLITSYRKRNKKSESQQVTSRSRNGSVSTILTRISFAPTVLIMMPVFNELPNVLIDAVFSIIKSSYPKHRIHVFISFDDDEESDLYLHLLRKLGASIQLHYPRTLDLIYEGVYFTILRFPHGGKKRTQERTFMVIERQYAEQIADMLRGDEMASSLLLLFMDSDIILHQESIQHLVDDITDSNKLATTGFMTCRTSGSHNQLHIFQDIEYMQGQAMDRLLENFCGAVTCLPGAFTMIRYDAFRNVARVYFASGRMVEVDSSSSSVSSVESTQPRRGRARSSTTTSSMSQASTAKKELGYFDYFRYHWGEDRVLTQLLMKSTPKRYNVSFCLRARCNTMAPFTFQTLFRQRRRWFLGVFTNEVTLLCSPSLWRRYPFLLITRLIHNSIRSLTFLSYIIVIMILVSNETNNNSSVPKWLALATLLFPLVLNWVIMMIVGIKLHRFKAFLYPILHIVYPFFSWFVTMYSIITCRSTVPWGTRETELISTSTQSKSKQKQQFYSDDYNKYVFSIIDDHVVTIPGVELDTRRPSYESTRTSSSDEQTLRTVSLATIAAGNLTVPNRGIPVSRVPTMSSTSLSSTAPTVVNEEVSLPMGISPITPVLTPALAPQAPPRTHQYNTRSNEQSQSVVSPTSLRRQASINSRRENTSLTRSNTVTSARSASIRMSIGSRADADEAVQVNMNGKRDSLMTFAANLLVAMDKPDGAAPWEDVPSPSTPGMAVRQVSTSPTRRSARKSPTTPTKPNF